MKAGTLAARFSKKNFRLSGNALTVLLSLPSLCTRDQVSQKGGFWVEEPIFASVKCSSLSSDNLTSRDIQLGVRISFVFNCKTSDERTPIACYSSFDRNDPKHLVHQDYPVGLNLIDDATLKKVLLLHKV